MTISRKYNHNQICTKDSFISVGKVYDYSEEGEYMQVKLLKDNSTDEGELRLTLETLTEPKGQVFDVMAAAGRYAYNGMWRIWDAGTYYPVGKYSGAIPEGPLIGYSLSNCVAQMCRHNIPLDRVSVIYSGTAARDEKGWERLIEGYANVHWRNFGKKAIDTVKELRKAGKILQYRTDECSESKYRSDIVWEKAI